MSSSNGGREEFKSGSASSGDGTVGSDKAVGALSKEDALPQFTARAVCSGMVAGTFGAFLAIYYGLKTGVTPSLNIISTLIGFSVVKVFVKLGTAKGVFPPQETAVIQTTATACCGVATSSGFSTGLLGMSQAAAELVQIPGSSPEDYVDLTWPKCVLWSSAVAFFGLFVAFPLRNYAIIQRKLTFPSGTASATVITTLHADPSQARKSMILLAQCVAVAFCWSSFCWVFDGVSDFPLFGLAAYEYDWAMDWDLGSIGVGMLLTSQINVSMLVGALSAFGFITPYIAMNHRCPEGSKTNNNPACWFYTDAPRYLDSQAYTMFPGIAMVVVDGFYSIFGLVLLLCKNMKGAKGKGADVSPDDNDAKQIALEDLFNAWQPPWWVALGGYLVAMASCIVIVSLLFGVVWWQVFLATIVTPIFAVAIIVAVGLTDWDVSSSFGKLMMFPLGMMNHGGSLIPSLAACVITISGCGAAAGLMQDFKTGYLVGASPRAMFFAQVCGAAYGCIIAPSIFVLFTSAYDLPNDPDNKEMSIHGRFGSVYRALAAVTTSDGLGALPKYCTTLMGICGAVALLLDLGADLAPATLAAYLPNVMGLSLGFLVGPESAIDFCIGGAIKAIWQRMAPDHCEKFYVVVASGLLAGGGFATLLQVFFSLGGLSAPIEVSFTPAR